MHDPNPAWASLSIACEDEAQQAMDAIHESMRELLANNSESLFGMHCTPDMIAKYTFYSPLADSKLDSALGPLAGGKVVRSCRQMQLAAAVVRCRVMF